MINLKRITQAIETLLKDNLGVVNSQASKDGYTIERNAARNSDPNIAARGKGWIGIYRAKLNYTPLTLNQWLASIEIDVELQVAHFQSGDIAEDRLQDGEKAILDVMTANLNLSGTVGMTNGYDVTYEYNADVQQGLYHHSSVITIKAELQVTM